MSAPHPTVAKSTVAKSTDIPRNCFTCAFARGRECLALTLDEDVDQPIIDYVSAHADLDGDGMPIDNAPCPRWVP